MTKEEAQVRLDEIIRPSAIFNYLPIGYILSEKQPNMPTMSQYKLYKPDYTQLELAEIQRLKEVIDG